MAQAWYATREQVKSALDIAETARNNPQIDRAIGSASRSIEQQLHRRLYPWDGTRYKGFRPWADGNSSWRLWLGEDELISLTTLTVGGTTISSSDYFLEPSSAAQLLRPYESIEMDLSSNSVFAAGETWQRAVALTGTFGYSEEQEQVGTLADNLDANLSDTAVITWTAPQRVGTGSILKVDSERLIVTNTSFVDTAQNTGSALAASNADVTLTVSSGTDFYFGEVIRVDSEKMLVVDTAATTITLKRAWDGTVLAAHSAAVDIYGSTGIEVERAQLGTSLAAHTTADVVYRWVVPPLVNDLCVAEALTQLQNEESAYARQGGGTGEGNFEPPGRGLPALRKQVYNAFGRKARMRTV